MATTAVRQLREAKGMTLEGLAHESGISVSQLSRIERGKREPKLADLERIAERLGVDVSDLLPQRTVPVVGYVGAGAQTHAFADVQGELDRVPAPDGSTEDTVAVEIRGESLGSFFDQWMVFYDDVRNPPTANMIGKLCVVGLADGRVLIKKLKRGDLPGHYTLLSQFEPPIYDTIVEWCALVKNMVPR